MRMTLKRLTAWMLTLMMVFSCVSASAVDGSVVDYSDSTSAYDVMPLDDGTSENITVTFVINNSAYTSDPGSGTTHITAKAPIEGGALAYTKWAGRYKVTGTGTVCSYDIPAGTSLSDNGYSFPALSVENIGNTNTYSYTSLTTWVTPGGMVCSTNTVFTENTTLQLQLYETAVEAYSLDFVCGEDNHSIKSIGSFQLGQSISQAYIDAATEAANAFESQFCTYGPASGQRLQKWQLKKTATGEMVDLVAGMAITEEYVNSQFGTAIKVYAVWEENASTPVTATFQYVTTDAEGTQTVTNIETRSLNAGDALGALPDMTAYNTPYETFESWQYTDAEGNEQTAMAETVIMEDTVYTAVFTEVPCVSVLFHDMQPAGTEAGIALDLSVPEGMTLAAAIADNDPALEDGTQVSGCIWRTEAGELADMSAVVAADSEIHLYTYTYQIVLTLNPNTAAEAAGIMTLSLVETDTAEDGTITMTITAREGEQLTADDFIVNGTDMTQYAWTDGNGNAIDLQKLMDEGVTESITATSDGTLAATDLTLTLELTLDGETITHVITKPEGNTLTAEDFVVNGIDLTVFTWSDEDGTVVSLESLVGSELTQNMVLTSEGALNSSLATNSGHNVNFYVYIDNVPVKVASKTVTSYQSGGRYYLSAATLASVFGEYGFSASQLQVGTRYFPHKDPHLTALWADTPVLEDNGLYYSPIVTHTGDADVYYLPAQTITNSNEHNDNTVVQANSFYTVRVEDSEGLVYTEDTLPEETLTFTGGSTSMTVKVLEGVVWKCIGLETGAIVMSVDNGDGTVTFNIDSITEPYKISIAGSIRVIYNLNLPQTPADAEYGKPTINGQVEYSELLKTANAAAYAPLAPNPSSYFYTSGKYLGEATFLGWAVNGDTANLAQPGETLNLTEYDGQTVTLTAQWETLLGDDVSILNSSMVNFFVALNAVSEGTTAWQGNTKTEKFTKSVYTMDCGVTGTQTVNYRLFDHEIGGEDGQYAVLGDTSGENLNAIHSSIVSTLSAGHTVSGSDGNSYTFTGTFPSDETVLRNVRNMVDNGQTTIKINDRVIPSSELTTTNFTVKWYVFKVSSDDGWHIDGILVAKSGEMIVTKTFAGDEAAISAIKTNFTINVSGDGAVHAGGTLHVTNATSYDGNNTYTWKVPVDQYYDYTVTESNYQYNADLATYKSQYRVRYSNTASQNTGGWRTYNDSTSITVTGRGYSDTSDERLTVDFLNTYTAPGTVVVQKVDAATGNLMPNVSFTIGGTRGDENQTPLHMYQVGDSHYSADPTTSGGTLTSTITTDSSGQAYLWIGGGNYWLEEVVPDGYDDPGRISVELKGDASNSYKVVEISSATAVNETTEKDFVTIGGDNSLTLTVKNYSRTIDLKVTKDWLNDENKLVTIQLYRDGKTLGSNFAVTLDGSEGWTHTFEDLPLYADGGLAQYTIREEKIGDFMFSDEYQSQGGYLYYSVVSSDMIYLDEDGNATDDMTQVKTIALEVSNDRKSGSLSIAKVDGKGAALGGAVFYLYEAQAAGSSVPTVTKDNDGHNVLSGLTQVATATSAANGTVSFGDVNAGRYYMIEHSAPTGYTGTDLVYLIQFDGVNSSMQYYSDGTWTPTAKRVVNESVTINLPVTKKWVDNDNAFGRRPNSITVTLTGTATGKVVSTQTEKITADDSDANFGESGTTEQSSTWTHTFTDLPQYSAGNPITYTVSESAVAGYTTTYDQDKLEITNELLDNLTYTVNKLVEGNFADPSKAFSFTAVVRNSQGNVVNSLDFTLAHGGSETITGLPYGATVEVTENPDGYTAQYMLGTTREDGASYTSGAILDSSQGVTFINTKNVSIDTGVDLDGLPYIMLLLGAAGISLVWLLLRRSRKNED